MRISYLKQSINVKRHWKSCSTIVRSFSNSSSNDYILQSSMWYKPIVFLSESYKRSSFIKYLTVGLNKSAWCNVKRNYCSSGEMKSTLDSVGDIVDEDMLNKGLQRQMAITKGDQQKLLQQKPHQPHNPHSLKVAIIGAPNAGKSTLANQLIGWKFAPVSSKVHTTRYKSIGILTQENKQIIFLDTPGLVTPMSVKKHNLEKSLLRDPHSTLFEADIILLLVDISNVWHCREMGPEILKTLHAHKDKEIVLVLNKIDLRKNKLDLLHVARILTGGRLKNNETWCKPLRTTKKKKTDLKSLFEEYENKSMKLELKDKYKDSQCEHQQSIIDTGEVENHIYKDTDLETIQNVKDCHVSEYQSDSRSNETLSDISTNKEVDFTDIDTRCKSQRIDSSATGFIQDTSQVAPRTEMPSVDNDISNSSVILNDWVMASGENSENLQKGRLDLNDEKEWRLYYWKHLRKIENELESYKSFGEFERIMYVSALEGNGVGEIKEYLLSKAKPGKWIYNESIITDQDPIEMAKFCIWEKMLDHLPDRVPYNVKVQPTLWVVDDNDYLRAEFNLICAKKHEVPAVLGPKGSITKKIAAEAKQELMNTFKREMSLRLVVQVPKKNKR